MVVNVCLSAMFFLHVLVRSVDVFNFGVVVLVRMRGEEMSPVLTTMQVVRDVEVLVPVHHRSVSVMTFCSLRHPTHPPQS
jgi:hypothetical protein